MVRRTKPLRQSLQVYETRRRDSVNQRGVGSTSIGSSGPTEWPNSKRAQFFFFNWSAASPVRANDSRAFCNAAFFGSIRCQRRKLRSPSFIAAVDSDRSDWHRNRDFEGRLDFAVCPVCFSANLCRRYKQIRSGETQKGRGTGLGLSLSLYIVCLHQGIIRVITEAQVGSTFEIYLPLTQADRNVSPSAEDAVSNVIEEKIQTIAVVDDQLSIRQLLNSCLKRLGYSVSSIGPFVYRL